MREGGLSGPPFFVIDLTVSRGFFWGFGRIPDKFFSSSLGSPPICARRFTEVRHFGNNVRTWLHFPVIEALTICNVLVTSRDIA